MEELAPLKGLLAPQWCKLRMGQAAGSEETARELGRCTDLREAAAEVVAGGPGLMRYAPGSATASARRARRMPGCFRLAKRAGAMGRPWSIIGGCRMRRRMHARRSLLPRLPTRSALAPRATKQTGLRLLHLSSRRLLAAILAVSGSQWAADATGAFTTSALGGVYRWLLSRGMAQAARRADLLTLWTVAWPMRAAWRVPMGARRRLTLRAMEAVRDLTSGRHQPSAAGAGAAQAMMAV